MGLFDFVKKLSLGLPKKLKKPSELEKILSANVLTG